MSNSIIIYALETGFCLAIFYLLYRLLLSRDTFFAVNRFYLISSALLSFAIPLIRIDLAPPAAVSEAYEIREVVVNSGGSSSQTGFSLTFWDFALAVYLAGAAFFLFRFLYKLISLKSLVSKNAVQKINGGKLVLLKEKAAPFSFFNYVFLGENFKFDEEGKRILTHEKAHINLLHSLDVILFETIKIIQWFNPFAWLYERASRETREYQADKRVINDGCDKDDYKRLILKQTAGIDLFQIANNLNYHTIKKRINMLTKSKTRNIAIIKLLIVAPISALLFIAISCDKGGTEEFFIARNSDGEKVKLNARPDSLPRFPGGYKARANYIEENMKVPQKFIERGTPGKVTVRFEVAADGTIENARVAQSCEMGEGWKHEELGYGCDEEALRLVKNMPEWKPAIYKGEPIVATHSLILFFGNDNMRKKWDEYYENKGDWIEFKPVLNEKAPKGKKGESRSMPEFPGGYYKMDDYFESNLEYPKEALKNGIEGTVQVKFKLYYKGNISEAKVIKSVGYGCDEEALRLVNSMPNWEVSEKMRGKDYFIVKVPIKFRIGTMKKTLNSFLSVF